MATLRAVGRANGTVLCGSGHAHGTSAPFGSSVPEWPPARYLGPRSEENASWSAAGVVPALRQAWSQPSAVAP